MKSAPDDVYFPKFVAVILTQGNICYLLGIADRDTSIELMLEHPGFLQLSPRNH